ncbi:tyrosinase family protein [Actinomadura harenae]|nr:tyrosinase family protein [Actinomadura harenae]
MGNNTVAVRQSIWSLEPATAFSSSVMLNYAKAVAVMRGRKPDDPTSWSYQAAIHGTRAPVPPGADWNQCQHATWFFFPWHRMYLWFFEKIVREAIQEAGADPTGWAVPYWNYSDGPLNVVSTLPLAFRTPTLPDGSVNPLYLPYPNRNENTSSDKKQGVGLIGAGINDGGQIPPRYVSHAQAFTLGNFGYPPPPDPSFGGPQTGFQHEGSDFGQLELLPHNPVHVFTGGYNELADCTKGWMTDPDCAAADPVFWAHHSNIDRLWKRWLDTPGHLNPTDQSWLSRSFRFYDPDRKGFVTMTANDVLDTVAQLGYGYEDDPAPVSLALRPAVAAVPAPPAVTRTTLASAGPLHLSPTTVSITGTVTTPPPGAQALLAAGPGEPRHLSLNLKNVEREQDAPLVFDVYLNLPDDQPPHDKTIYYVGPMAFFGNGHHHGMDMGDTTEHHAGMSFSYGITNLVQEQRAQGAWSDTSFRVTLIVGGHREEGTPPPPAMVHIGSVTITAE